MYSPDLVRSEVDLFRSINDRLHGKHFPSNHVVIVTVEQRVSSAGVNFHEGNMQDNVYRWQKFKVNADD